MTTTVKQLGQSAMSATANTTLYTTPASTKTIVKEILLCNTDSVARTVTIKAGASPATAVSATILSALSLAAGETKFISLSTVLETGHLITGSASTGAVVSCTISGVEVV